jgi:hypothetical protein
MEHYKLYNVLYKILYMMPKSIIEHIIFKYAIDTRRYIHKYTISNDSYKRNPSYEGCYNNIRYNKQLGIMCCETGENYKLIDYKTGAEHDGSIINLKSFDYMFIDIDIDSVYISYVIYFDDDAIITYSFFDGMQRFILRDKVYMRVRIGSCNYDPTCVYNNSIYCGYFEDKKYHIRVYDLISLRTIKISNEYSCKSEYYSRNKNRLMSIYNDIIYVYESDTTGNIDIHTYDVNTIERLNQYHHKCDVEWKYMILHENKLYKYAYGKICIYDATTFGHICSFPVNTHLKHNSRISISNNVLMISDDQYILFYDII